MHGRYATYRVTGDAHELALRAEEGLLPLLRAQAGFHAYNIAISGDELISMSAWATIEQAEAATTAVADWVAENMADGIELIDVRHGEILLSTTLGVSPSTTARR